MERNWLGWMVLLPLMGSVMGSVMGSTDVIAQEVPSTGGLRLRPLPASEVEALPPMQGGTRSPVVPVAPTPLPPDRGGFPAAPPAPAPATPDPQRGPVVTEPEPPKPTVQLAPLQRSPIRLFNLETANQLNWGELAITAGVRAFGNDRVTAGSALEVYSGSIDYGIDERLQVGVAFLFYDDPLGRPVGTVNNASLAITAIAPNFKYSLLQTETTRLSLGGSLEYLNVSTLGSDFLGGTASSGSLAGSVFLPLTYAPSPEVQLTVTPQVSVLPNTIGTANFLAPFLALALGSTGKLRPV
ncbi:MAG: hypothetical protein HC919_02480 [Oscillatoriales cyanobacterium SM2_2_1]|nr:hypothetical protein [Oscillatoriales cyanobacterium SM2_2_1]